MTTNSELDQLLEFFKALADASRLKIVGLLARDSFTGEQLAAILELRPSTVSHHLARLARAGLVSARAEGYYSVYELETDALERMAHQLLTRQTLLAMAAELDLEAYDRKVLRDFSRPDGRLRIIPAQRKKRAAVLRHLVSDFDFGRRYSEPQVNKILARYHEDTATLRRELVGMDLLRQQRGEYWRPEP